MDNNSLSMNAPSDDQSERFRRLKTELHEQLLASLDLSVVGKMREEDLRAAIRREAGELCRRRSDLLNLSEQQRLVEEVMDETFGLGPLEPLLKDMTISDILINGPDTVYVERHGRLERENISFSSEKHLRDIVQRIVGRVGRRVDESTPMVDARLADGSRVNAIIPPLALDGTLVSIRRFGAKPLLAKNLLANKSITKEMLDFLAGCVKARLNILISGGTGSGKTTLLNCLSSFIPPTERVATIEDAAELRLQDSEGNRHPHVVRMETRPANVEGTGEVLARDLLKNALRMRPDRIIIGECRGAEAFDMLQAMNTGHEGSLTTIHANEARDALGRMEMMVGMAVMELPIWIIRRQIASAINVIVQVTRLPGGARKIIQVSEVTGMEENIITMQELFGFKQTGLDEEGQAKGFFYSTGLRAHFQERLVSRGVRLPPTTFESKQTPI